MDVCHKNDANFELFLSNTIESAAKKTNLPSLQAEFATVKGSISSFAPSVISVFNKLLEIRLTISISDIQELQKLVKEFLNSKKNKSAIDNE